MEIYVSFRCRMLFLVVLCCLIFIFHVNYHELSINSLCSEIHDQLHGNYMFFRCRMLSFVVLCCLIFIFHANYHELSINFGAHQFMTNYMVIICFLFLKRSGFLFLLELYNVMSKVASDNFGHQFPVLSQFRPFVATRKEEMAANISMA